MKGYTLDMSSLIREAYVRNPAKANVCIDAFADVAMHTFILMSSYFGDVFGNVAEPELFSKCDVDTGP